MAALVTFLCSQQSGQDHWTVDPGSRRKQRPPLTRESVGGLSSVRTRVAAVHQGPWARPRWPAVRSDQVCALAELDRSLRPATTARQVAAAQQSRRPRASTAVSSPVATRSRRRPRLTANASRTSTGSAVPALRSSTWASHPSTAPGSRRVNGGSALSGPGVALEEESLQGTEFRPAQIGPHGGKSICGSLEGSPGSRAGGVPPPRQPLKAVRRVTESGGAACGGWCRPPGRFPAASDHRFHPGQTCR